MTTHAKATYRSTALAVEPEILDACCGGRHWWWDKAHPLAIYMDEREAPRGSIDVRPDWECQPDLLGDFRAMPFEDGTFQLVLFDPPHLVREGLHPRGYIPLKYGALFTEAEQDDLHRGFAECWRVLAPGGTLVFKWGANSIARVEQHFPATPIVGTRSPRGGQTRWFIFYKPLDAATYDPCGCRERCGDDGDIDGPGVCKGLPLPDRPPLVEIVLVPRRRRDNAR